ncbi:MAG: DUF721 domain-containing protein, partial [Actinomycetota bacterium]|nr:DUF721 domain-containing protein [Actinomycetota bacterium]
MRRRAPRPLAPAVDALARRLRPATTLGAVQGAWERAVGAHVAREARPVAEREGTVTVLCSSSLWAHEVELLGPTLLEAVNGVLAAEGGPVVR